MNFDIVNTACSSAWDYPVLDIGSRALRNCCKTPHNKIPVTDLALGTDLFKKFIPIMDIKRDLLSGRKNINCMSCWNSESLGGKSARTGFEKFAKFINATKWTKLTLAETKNKLLNLSEADKEELVNWEHPEHLEIMLSTVCDLKCVYCNQNFSSQWYTEKLKYKEIPIKEANTNIEEYETIWWTWFESVACKTTNQISFVGGEPLLDDKLYQYIDRIIDIRQSKNISSNMNISIVTNFNTPPKYLNKLLKLIERISITPGLDLAVCISFESIGNRTEFIRTGVEWKLFQNNINTLISFVDSNNIQNTTINISPSFCSLSISGIMPFVEYIMTLNEIYSKFLWISTTHVDYPAWCSPFVLTNDYIKYIDDVIDYLKNKNVQQKIHYFNAWRDDFINYLNTIKTGIYNSNLDVNTSNRIRKDFANNIDKISTRRNLDFNGTFPEMVEFYNLCKQLN